MNDTSIAILPNDDGTFDVLTEDGTRYWRCHPIEADTGWRLDIASKIAVTFRFDYVELPPRSDDD